MKKLLIALLFPVLLCAQGELIVKKSDWTTDYKTAVKKAEKEDKNILVFFTGSDWCPPCIALKKDFFETASFDTYAKEYVLLYIDIPRNRDLLSADQLAHNKELASKYNKRGSVPMLKILNDNGKELGALSGYSMNGEIQYHTKFLDKYYK
ncbi:thioredoxin family protein [Cellulophaga baltica]|jgi:thioredoxin-related protein|uniref:Thioredoxin-related protein n=2 Tax=Cellulophaga baltica TaxID=76594 RepID=A0A1G7J0K7_9FLAO|nr:thioredoxin family protein [Cellulophaga baltica]WFO17002.1 thioredoxin family protein [Cellulophaga baltica 4]AIZ42566.1 protein-disulfide isomerase [Cellulophaga baltica 18]MBA6315898.1 thioredoxin family protein [Cellulophaga baltica]MCR1025980.1 thioredoxin family protein [Cellulophaga baltica]SDF18403.1 Thioredoxin-related protein [Cellulophaga baltica]